VKRTRLLGVDFGTVRVGLAVSDSERIIASPLTIYRRKDTTADAAYFQQLVAGEEIGGLVVGLPLHMSGDEGGKAKEARAFGDWLAGVTELRVTYWDERYSSADADAAMIGAKLTPKQRQERRDKVAAQLILQGYLESQRSR